MKIAELTCYLNESRQIYLEGNGYKTTPGRWHVNNPESTVDLINGIYKGNRLPEEHAWMLCLDNKSKVIGIFEVAKGNATTTIMPIREICRNALLVNAVGVVLVHNHPTGDVTPSDVDIATTVELKNAMKTIGITLCDHIIIGDTYCSMKEDAYI
jgi:DNA repair protein RadC